jgi:hypothetical protein
VKLIENWKEAHKFLSVWAAGLLGLIAALEPHWPELQTRLPPGWAAYGAGAILIARLVRQSNVEPPKVTP